MKNKYKIQFIPGTNLPQEYAGYNAKTPYAFEFNKFEPSGDNGNYVESVKYYENSILIHKQRMANKIPNAFNKVDK